MVHDQYRHPHESKHTIDEVLGWFQQAKLEFVRGVPSVTPYANDGIANANVFEPQPVGTPLDHAIVQLQETVRGNREGGFFLMIAHKPRGVMTAVKQRANTRAGHRPGTSNDPRWRPTSRLICH
jgi:hypothetical protein